MPRCSIATASLAIVTLLLSGWSAATTASEPAPLKLLLVTGGCCHDYPAQAKALQEIFAAADVDAQWTVINEGGTGTRAMIDLYNDPDWAKGYDVVIHNPCFADTDDPDYIRQITAAHAAGANAVVLHCAMHTYRSAKIDDWRELLGVTSRRHEHQSRYGIDLVAAEHPIMEGFPTDFKTEKDELYLIEKVWPSAEVLATTTSERSGEKHPVLWTNQYGKARVFGTTYGHTEATLRQQAFARVLIRGTLWAAGRLQP